MAVQGIYNKSKAEDFESHTSFEMEAESATPGYGKFIVEPLENGFGHTIGNALRRVLLSQMEGVAASCIRIEGAPHEFMALEGVMEDVMEIILNVKKLKFRCDADVAMPRTLELVATKAGEVTGADVREDGIIQVINKDLKICTLSADRPLDRPFRIEIDLARGAGYVASENNRSSEQPVGSIPIDSLFNPIERVRYDVQASHFGERTDLDRLVLQVWTDQRIDPKDAVMQAAQILRAKLGVFSAVDVNAAPAAIGLSDEERELLEKLSKNVADLDLSVRAVNCLNGDSIHFVGELVQRSENQMLKCRNFGKKSLTEIKQKLEDMGLHLEMALSENVKEELNRQIAQNQVQSASKE